MAIPIIMPRQGQSVETCIISKWYKSIGDRVEKGDLLFGYETDKASFEAEATENGILLEIFYSEGDEVPVLTNVAVIGQPGEDISAFFPSSTDFKPEFITKDNIQNGNENQKVEHFEETSGEKIISPRARKTAAHLNVDINSISGSGPYGRIIEKDILAVSKNLVNITPLAKAIAKDLNVEFPEHGTGLGGRIISADILASKKTNNCDFEIQKISNMRKIIASRMHNSLQNSAQLTHHISADARKLLEWRNYFKQENQKGKMENITINDMVCFAVIRTLKKHLKVNSHFLGDSVKIFNKIHLGFAVDTERGLMVPALKNADDLNISGLSLQLKNLAGQCKKGNIDTDLLSGEAASFTVSNLGAFGIEMFTPVINLPQVAILGVNTILHRPADLGNGVFGFIPYIGLSLTYDHRALDGAPASAFLQDLKLEIEKLDFERI
ncbi:MAG: dihydrolipoamide acetyltransferase family protein [Bacteroidales bacterium]